MLKKLLELGVIKIGFETNHERDFFEENYLINQNEIEYCFKDSEDWNDNLEENYEVYEIEFTKKLGEE